MHGVLMVRAELGLITSSTEIPAKAQGCPGKIFAQPRSVLWFHTAIHNGAIRVFFGTCLL